MKIETNVIHRTRRSSETFGGEVRAIKEIGTSIRVECESRELPFAMKKLSEEGCVIVACGPGTIGQMILVAEKLQQGQVPISP